MASIFLSEQQVSYPKAINDIEQKKAPMLSLHADVVHTEYIIMQNLFRKFDLVIK